jgi:hypothetical protein
LQIAEAAYAKKRPAMDDFTTPILPPAVPLSSAIPSP